MMRTFQIEAVDRRMQPAIQRKIDNLNKPKGALGLLEEMAMQICLVQHTMEPRLAHPCHLLMGGDHGIQKEGVSATPREVTWQQMVNFTRGGGGVNMFCRQHGFDLSIVDVGVDHDLRGVSGIIDRKISWGTRNFLHEPAMTEEEMEQAIEVGISLIDDCRAKGCNIVCIGEMGAGNTSPSSIWMSLLCHIPLANCIGAGSGLDDSGIRHKQKVLQTSIDRFLLHPWSVPSVIRHFGGFEMVSAIGAMLRAAELKMLVMVDGFIMTACALAACSLDANAKDYMIFCHCGDESGHRQMLNFLGAKPLLQLGLRLGEGTGALCAYPLIDSAVRMINEMNNFDDANITKYF